MGLLDSLLYDPTQPGGGWLARWLQIANPTASTSTKPGAPTTPTAPPPGAPNFGPANVAPYPGSFAPSTGLLGESLFGRALRGGLAGLAGSTGYTGASAWGAGAMAGQKNEARRRAQYAQNALMGQQYQLGNLGLQRQLWMLNNPPPGYGSQGGAPSSGQPTPGTPPQVGMAPVTGGGANVNPQVAQAYGAGATAPQGQGAQGQPPQPNPNMSPSDLQALAQQYVQYGQMISPWDQKSGQQWIQMGISMDPSIQGTLALTKSQNTISNNRGGSQPMLNGVPLGRGVPTVQRMTDPQTGNEVPMLVYPMGEVEPLTQGGPSPAGGAPGGNNVGNIRAAGGGFRQYPDLASGIQGTISNLQAYGKQGINTVNGIISTWAPPSENDTQAYIADVAKQTGFKPDQPLNMNDPKVLTRLTMAIAAHEQGNPAADSGGGQGLVGQLGPYQNERFKTWATQLGDWGKNVRESYVGEQRATAIADALKATTSGAWSTEKSSLAAKLKAVGINLPPDVLGDPAQVQIALKDNFQSSLSQIKQFSSRPAAAELTLAQQNFANPNLQPEANLAIISQVIGTLRWDRDAYAAAQKKLDRMPGDPDAFAYEWGQKHPIQGYIDKAQQEIGPLKGMAKPTPAIGTVEGGYKFMGGDPSQQSSWQKVP